MENWSHGHLDRIEFRFFNSILLFHITFGQVMSSPKLIVHGSLFCFHGTGGQRHENRRRSHG